MDSLNQKQIASIRTRLFKKLILGADGDCWNWKERAVTAFGYGRMNAGRGVNLKAHRAAYLAMVGPIADGLCVLHKCDNPKCCNPAHLFLGTRADNNHDMAAKGRRKPRGPAINPRSPNCNPATGDRNGNSRANRQRRALLRLEMQA